MCHRNRQDEPSPWTKRKLPMSSGANWTHTVLHQNAVSAPPSTSPVLCLPNKTLNPSGATTATRKISRVISFPPSAALHQSNYPRTASNTRCPTNSVSLDRPPTNATDVSPPTWCADSSQTVNVHVRIRSKTSFPKRTGEYSPFFLYSRPLICRKFCKITKCSLF